MSGTTSIRCSHCHTITSNSDYCSHCGKIINVQLKRRLEREKKEQQQLKEELEKPKGKLSTLFQKALEHPNFLVRSLTRTVYSIWMFFGLLMGAIISAVIGLVSG